jgi:L-malate glycosyltransferase
MSHSLGHGGGERQLVLNALSLDRTRFEPHVASCEEGFQAQHLRKAGIPLFTIGSRSLMSAAALREGKRLRRYIQEQGIRVVQTFDFSMNVFGIPVARSIPGVLSISNLRCRMDLIPQRYRWLNHMAHRVSHAVVVNSESLRRHLETDYGIPLARIHTCHNGIDTKLFQRTPKENTSLVIGTVCVLRPEKNVGLLLEAFAAAAALRPGLKLLIVGSGPEESRLRELAGALGIEPQCVFQPSTPDVPRYLSSIDVFVLPSLTEGLSNAIMEAMACGCCVVASNVGGNPELITDGSSGLLFHSQDKQSLIGQLLRVVDDSELRSSLAERGAGRARECFSSERSARRMQEIYEILMQRDPTGR